jgi:homogentisate 1,2-dioxygenase
MRPSVRHFNNLQPIDNGLIRTGPDKDSVPASVQLRWDPFPASSLKTNWLTGLTTIATNGNNEMQTGGAVHHFVATDSMEDLAFVDTDGELMLVPYEGRIVVRSEMGQMHVAPGHLAVIPRGVKFAVDLLDSAARGYVCENYGPAFDLPEHGLLGPDANALPRDFEYPVASYDVSDNATKLVAKISGQLYATDLEHSPFDVVAWHGNLSPYRYELRRFCAVGPVIFDHPDPSIWTLLSNR